MLAAAALLVTTQVADAQFFGWGQSFRGYGFGNFGTGNGNGYGRSRPYADPFYFKPQHKRTTASPKNKKEKAAAAKTQVKRPPGPLLIAISLRHQRLTLYANGAAVAHAPVSTGTAGHPTPTGIFSVIGKERFHRSNLYSNAPMPFMQRITWSGVALHQGVLPGYPASHGCIRMPAQFAQYLWAITRTGARVIITRDDATPFDIAHANLFVPPKPDAEVSASAALKIAEGSEPGKTTDAPRPAQPGATDGAETKAPGAAAPGAAPKTAQAGTPPAPTGSITPPPLPPPPGAAPATAPEAPAAGAAGDNADKKAPAAAQAKEKAKPVSVFISRKTSRLYVRQGFEPIFDAPVTIRDAETPLGTHLYTAVELKDEGAAMRWVAVALASPSAVTETRLEIAHDTPRHSRKAERKNKSKDEQPQPTPVSASARTAASSALDRIEIPKETVDRISDMLSPGSSLIISDLPMSGETGKYTDFIILTR